jgi:glycosyltransferase involved in cell wall biosynthesis/SAM-dependent methyltransferase
MTGISTDKPRPDRLVGVEARKLYAAKLEEGFIAKYLSGPAILDIGYRGYEPDVVPIVPQAIGIDLDYPGYDGRTLPFPDNSQDAVFSSHCLEHAEDCRLAVQEWFRVLKTEGYLVLAVPHKYLYERRQRPPSRWNIDHRRFFTPGSLLARIEEALPPNTYRVRQLTDNDFTYTYSVPPDDHPGGCYEIELVIQKIAPPKWQLEDLALSERRPGVELALMKSEPSEEAEIAKGRIIYDGLNLALARGTGIATYTRILTRISQGLGYDVGVVFETPFTPPQDPMLRDILFFDQARPRNRPHKKSLLDRVSDRLLERLHPRLSLKPVPMRLGEAVDVRQFADRLPACNRVFAAREVFNKATRYFSQTGKFLQLDFDMSPNLFHCTYAIPVTAKNAQNVYTIHDLVPLRLPNSTMDDKNKMYSLLKEITNKSDHIVTVSETSKRHIVEILGFDEQRITNTYQTVIFPEEYLNRSDTYVANYLDGQHGLEMYGYLLFFGAVEPKKNVSRLIDAYLSSGVGLPLVLVVGEGWQNTAELSRLREHDSRPASSSVGGGIRRLEYTTRSNLVNLIRGARTVVFPSLLEGFGLPVLEAMTLGTPVITSNSGALSEIAGEAALLVDPYDVDDIARAIAVVAKDPDFCGELSYRGLVQAEKFSPRRYAERIGALYSALS